MDRPAKRWMVAIWALVMVLGSVPVIHAQANPTNVNELASKYSIRIVWETENYPVKTYYGPITAEHPGQAELAFYTPILVSEFKLYPAEFVKKSKLQRIVLCHNLAFSGQRRSAIPDFEHNTLYLDVARGSYNEIYMRKVLHHEFFHIVDLMDDGQLYRDPAWEKLNPPGFAYGAGGRNMQNDSTVSLINDSKLGFLNKYSTSGVEEDKAEMFSNMVVNYQGVAARAARDKVVAAKMQQMKVLVNKFSPQTNAAFWDVMSHRPMPRQ